jgi:hypothetical protein
MQRKTIGQFVEGDWQSFTLVSDIGGRGWTSRWINNDTGRSKQIPFGLLHGVTRTYRALNTASTSVLVRRTNGEEKA